MKRKITCFFAVLVLAFSCIMPVYATAELPFTQEQLDTYVTALSTAGNGNTSDLFTKYDYYVIVCDLACTELRLIPFDDYFASDNVTNTISFEISAEGSGAGKYASYNITTGERVVYNSGSLPEFVYKTNTGSVNYYIIETNCDFICNNVNYTDFFMIGSAPTVTPSPLPSQQPTPAPTPITLEQVTGAEVVTLGAKVITETVKKILIAVFGILCLILLAPLVKKFLRWLKGFIIRS